MAVSLDLNDPVGVNEKPVKSCAAVNALIQFQHGAYGLMPM
jgi:hypothetical protein